MMTIASSDVATLPKGQRIPLAAASPVLPQPAPLNSNSLQGFLELSPTRLIPVAPGCGWSLRPLVSFPDSW